jgi:hypothetical protein
MSFQNAGYANVPAGWTAEGQMALKTPNADPGWLRDIQLAAFPVPTLYITPVHPFLGAVSSCVADCLPAPGSRRARRRRCGRLRRDGARRGERLRRRGMPCGTVAVPCLRPARTTSARPRRGQECLPSPARRSVSLFISWWLVGSLWRSVPAGGAMHGVRAWIGRSAQLKRFQMTTGRYLVSEIHDQGRSARSGASCSGSAHGRACRGVKSRPGPAGR